MDENISVLRQRPVQPEVRTFRHLDLFSGIGGFAVAMREVFGEKHEVVAFCEINEWCQSLLKKRFPNTPIYDNVQNIGVKEVGKTIDIITGGFPCQDLSFAGNTKGIEAERSGLWKEYKRIISEIRPRWVLVENVSALLSGDNGNWFRKFLSDISEIGYNAEWHCLQAADVGAPHRRDRVWVIAYPNGNSFIDGWMGNTQAISEWVKHKKIRSQNRFKLRLVTENVAPEKWEYPIKNITRPLLVRNNDGLPFLVDQLKGLGNAIVPQVAEVFLHRIKQIEDLL